MTSLLNPATRRLGTDRTDADPAAAPQRPRPLVTVAVGGGLFAVAAPLVGFMAAGVIGWFLTGGGAHGAPRDGLRIGALGWLLAHGSGVHVEGVAITAIPLALTLLCAWAVWRTGHRVGELVAGHGPDAAALEDGARDWTVLAAGTLFAVGYLVAGVLTLSVAATAESDPATAPVVIWSLVMPVLVGGAAVSVGSGRAAIWMAQLPRPVRDALATARLMVLAWLGVSLLWFVGALAVDFGTAANVMSQLGPDAGEAVVLLVAMLLLVPNAAGFAGAYLLGPGFQVGSGALVTPQAAAIGALPMVPLLAALPGSGPAAGWVQWVVALPPLVALLAAGLAQRSRPTVRWDEGALRGCVAGALTGVAFAVVAALSGGSVGPGRMSEVGPLVGGVLLHGVAAFGVGGLLGGLAMTAWQRRRARLLDHETRSVPADGHS